MNVGGVSDGTSGVGCGTTCFLFSGSRTMCVHLRTCVICEEKANKFIRLCNKRANILSRWLSVKVNGNSAAHEDCLERIGLRSLPSVAQEDIPAVREIMSRVATVVRDVRAARCLRRRPLWCRLEVCL